MEYTVVTHKSWFERIRSSFGGVLFGLLLFCAGTALLWWNEGDFVATRDALKEAQSLTVELGDPSVINPAMQGKLVHAVGFADTKERLFDPVFGVGSVGIALERHVEYYQWTESSRSETRKLVGGGEETVTTYSYAPAWVHSPVDSSTFHAPNARMQYANSVCLPGVQDETIYASHVQFGAYRLPEFLIHSIGNERPLPCTLDAGTVNNLNQTILGARPAMNQGGFAGFGQQTTGFGGFSSQTANFVHASGNQLYLGASPSSPSIGDMRLHFTITPPATVSLLAQVSADTFQTYRSANGKTISALAMGEQTLEAMFTSKQSQNKMFAWIFRALGTILVIFAFGLVTKPLSVLASVLPFLGSIVEMGTGFVSFIVGLAWSFVIIALAWIAYRPVVGGALLIMAALLLIALFLKSRSPSAE